MASSTASRKYPHRLYDEGKSPIQYKKMNHNFYASNLQMVEEAVSFAVWEDLKNSAVGVFAKLKDVEYTFSAKEVHYFLTNQLAIESRNEFWSLLGGTPIRFSLNEYEAITEFNCAPVDESDRVDIDHKDFWLEMKLSPSSGPTLKELMAVFVECRNWSFGKKRMLGLLAIISIGIYGISPFSRIPLDEAKRVLDKDAFERYPWGRVGFSSIVSSIKNPILYGDKSYRVHGCVHVLLVWIYESVPTIAKRYGNKIEGVDLPLLGWRGSRKRINFSDFCAKEEKEYDQIRVRHMVSTSEEDRFPYWEGDIAQVELDNLVTDIIHGELNLTF